MLIEGWDSAVCKILIDLSPSLSLVRSAQKYFRVLTPHAEREARIYGADSFGNEHRTFAAHIKLQEIVPGVALQFMGHAPPGVCCSELQLEAMAVECSPASQLRAPRAVVRALACVCEEAQNASGAGSG